ncbi:phospholipase D-like domain-containing protein [Pseudarthrobacter sp. TAF60_1]|uniref:phospholipase D-like domain-containing protein n=1 Tax=Pseudarthrobacter sp. TAF60_1 TaxID=3233071 RepID=UPI003F9D1AC6
MGDVPFDPVGGISPIRGIDPLPTIDAVPQIGSVPANPPFRRQDLPDGVQASFSAGVLQTLARRLDPDLDIKHPFWLDTVDLAIGDPVAPVREARKLADIVFFMEHPERMNNAGEGRLSDPEDEDFYKTRAEWDLYLTIVTRRLDPTYKPTVFLPELASRSYDGFIAKQTTGRATLMVNGRDSDGTGKLGKLVQRNNPKSWSLVGGSKDDVSTFTLMQKAVEQLGKGDALYIASWQFAPQDTQLTIERPGIGTHWSDLLVKKANDGVKVRVIVAQHPNGSGLMTPLAPLDEVIKNVSEGQGDNFKYILSPLGEIAVHHQKFVVALKGNTATAFCGGLDISFHRTPRGYWHINWVWHDVGAQLEGMIARDLEREFVERWNRERTSSKVRLTGWQDPETLAQSSGGGNGAAAVNGQKLQMVRTVASGQTRFQALSSRVPVIRDDIWRGYFRLIGRATRFIYLENQYFHVPELADAIVKQAQAIPQLIVMVVVGTGTDDRKRVDPTEKDQGERDRQQNAVNFYQNEMWYRMKFFKRLLHGIPESRVSVYTLRYEDGITHAKLVLVDDEALTLGSANANFRGFVRDTELNVILDDPKTVRDFRLRLWAHNLHVPPGEVAKWTVDDFIKRWNHAAGQNFRVRKEPSRLVGESIIPFDPLNTHDPNYEEGRNAPIFGFIPPEHHF